MKKEFSKEDISLFNRAVYEYMLSLANDFSALDKLTDRYIPDYAKKYKKLYTLEEISRLTKLVDSIASQIQFKSKQFIKEYVGIKVPNVTIRDWLLYNNFMSNGEFNSFVYYSERFNTYKHLISTMHKINVVNQNAIVTVFRDCRTGELNDLIITIDNTISKIEDVGDVEVSDCECNDVSEASNE